MESQQQQQQLSQQIISQQTSQPQQPQFAQPQQPQFAQPQQPQFAQPQQPQFVQPQQPQFAQPQQSPVPEPINNQYVINNVQQLFELNPNLVNFKSSFVIQSLTNEPFMGLVLNQQALDSGNTLEFKVAEQGYLSGEITQDNNVYTNWYLALKSQKPNKVMINIQSIPVAPRSVQQQNQVVDPYNVDAHPYSHKPIRNSFFNTHASTLLIIGIGLTIAYLGYRYYKERNKSAYKMNNAAAALFPEHIAQGNVKNPVIAAIQDTMPAAVSTVPVVAPAPVAPAPVAPAPAIVPPVVAPIASAPPVVAAPVVAAPVIPELQGTSVSSILGDDLMSAINALPMIDKK
jgi:hypothetical protein